VAAAIVAGVRVRMPGFLVAVVPMATLMATLLPNSSLFEQRRNSKPAQPGGSTWADVVSSPAGGGVMS